MPKNRSNLTPINMSVHAEEISRAVKRDGRKKAKGKNKEEKKDVIENQPFFKEFNPKVKPMVWDAYHNALKLKREGGRTWKKDVQSDIANSLFPEALEWVEKNDPKMADKVSDLPGYVKFKLFTWAGWGWEKSMKFYKEGQEKRKRSLAKRRRKAFPTIMMASYLFDKGIPVPEIAEKLGIKRPNVYKLLKRADTLRQTWRFKFAMRYRGDAKIDKYGLLPDQYLVLEKIKDGKAVYFIWSSRIQSTSVRFLKNKKQLWSGKQTIQSIQKTELSRKESLELCEKAITPLIAASTFPVEYKEKEKELTKEEQKIADDKFMIYFDNKYSKKALAKGPVIIRLSSMEELSNPDIVQQMVDAKDSGRGYEIAAA